MTPPNAHATAGRISQRMLHVQAPMIPVVGEMIKRHPGTISLGQGVVHYGPPGSVAEAVGRAASEDPRTYRYGLAFGIDELLEAIRQKLAADNGVTVTPQQRIAVTAGSNMGFLNAVLAIADVNDEVILLAPFYFNHEMAIDIAGCRAVIVPTDSEYQPDVPAIEAAITDRTRAVVTISPNNPTGVVYPEATLRAINELCKRRGIYHIADEAYEYFTHGEVAHFSPASIPESSGGTISLYSLSKAYGMAGWRVGYMLMPAHLEEAVKKIQDTNLICPPVINQLAAVAAMKTGRPWCMERIASFRKVRDMVLGELAQLGDCIHVPRPTGAFYALMSLDTPRSDMDLVEALIRDFGVAVMPGSTFGTPAPAPGSAAGSGCYLRIAYGALSPDAVAQGMDRLTRGLKHLLRV